MIYAHKSECPKGKLNVSSGLTPSQVFHNRRDFERGLLAVILDKNRKTGFQQMERVAQTISTVLPPDSSWTLLAHWLNALAADRLPLTSKSLELLRQVGKSLKDLDRQAQQVPQAGWVMPLEVAFLVVPSMPAWAPPKRRATRIRNDGQRYWAGSKPRKIWRPYAYPSLMLQTSLQRVNGAMF